MEQAVGVVLQATDDIMNTHSHSLYRLCEIHSFRTALLLHRAQDVGRLDAQHIAQASGHPLLMRNTNLFLLRLFPLADFMDLIPHE